MAWIPNVTQRFSRKGWDNENWFERFRNLRHPPGLSSVPEAGAFPRLTSPFIPLAVLISRCAPTNWTLEEARRYALNREFYVSVRNLTPHENGRLGSLKKMPKHLESYRPIQVEGGGKATMEGEGFLLLRLFCLPTPSSFLHSSSPFTPERMLQETWHCSTFRPCGSRQNKNRPW